MPTCAGVTCRVTGHRSDIAMGTGRPTLAGLPHGAVPDYRRPEGVRARHVSDAVAAMEIMRRTVAECPDDVTLGLTTMEGEPIMARHGTPRVTRTRSRRVCLVQTM